MAVCKCKMCGGDLQITELDKVVECEYCVVSVGRSGSKWYLAAMNNWDERDVTFKLPFEAADGTRATLWRDGVNAHRNGQDYMAESVGVNNGELTVHLAPGGGCVLVF